MGMKTNETTMNEKTESNVYLHSNKDIKSDEKENKYLTLKCNR